MADLFAICPDSATLAAVRAPFDRSCGLPRVSIDSGTGLPCRDGFATQHALASEVILAPDGTVAAQVHPALDATVAKIADVKAKLVARKTAEAENAAKNLGIAAADVAKIRVVTRAEADAEIEAARAKAPKIEEVAKP